MGWLDGVVEWSGWLLENVLTWSSLISFSATGMFLHHCALFVTRCHCLDGFEGDRCETNMDDCEDNSCKNNATCVDEIQSYSCRCLTGFTGMPWSGSPHT